MTGDQDNNPSEDPEFQFQLDGLYESNDIRFRYPSDWIISEENYAEEFSISVNSPETAFWSLFVFNDRPDPEYVIETAIESLRSEYDEIDVYPSTARISNRDTVARNVEFVCLELINSAFLRAFQTDAHTALVLFQANDAELDVSQGIMEGICTSLECGPPSFDF